jgi:hypothetical protein
MAVDHGFEYVKFFLLLGFAACIPAINSLMAMAGGAMAGGSSDGRHPSQSA